MVPGPIPMTECMMSADSGTEANILGQAFGEEQRGGRRSRRWGLPRRTSCDPRELPLWGRVALEKGNREEEDWHGALEFAMKAGNVAKVG